MALWSVYEIVKKRGAPHALPLGRVRAEHQPAAINRAHTKFKIPMDRNRLSVRLWKDDPMCLGRKQTSKEGSPESG